MEKVEEMSDTETLSPTGATGLDEVTFTQSDPNSILDSVKKDCGIMADYIYFDDTITRYINLVFVTLHQLGVGPEIPFSISDRNDTWSSFSTNECVIGMVKPYVSIKVRTMFDPPSSSFVLDAMQKQIAEYEWRLNVAVETPSLGGNHISGGDDSNE